MLLLLFLGCTETHIEQITEEPPVEVFNYAVEPAKLKFGEQDLGTSSYEVLRILNTGEVELMIKDVLVPPELGLETTVPDVPFISGGGYQEVIVFWNPADTHGLDTELSLTITGPEGDIDLAVPIMGMGRGAVPTLSREDYEFGEVKVGCSSKAALTLTNTGNEDLIVDELYLMGGDQYTLDEDDLDGLPWELKPFGSHALKVVYEPTERQVDLSLLEVVAGSVTATTTIAGTGIIDGEEHLEYRASEGGLTTALFHINEVAIDGPYGTHAQRFEDGIPYFFQTLLDNHARFRVAFVWNRNGTVDGTHSYIDHTMTASQAANAAMDMIQAGGNAGDNDASFTTLQNAISENSSWLFEDAWADSRLNLIMVNRDMEQSGGHWGTYVATAQAYKEDPDDVVYHAIAGDGSGCDGAEATTFQQAVTATGGSFISLCETDWEDPMKTLAAASMDGTPVFPLTGYPLVSTIEVAVDGDKNYPGWFYDSSLNAIAFEEAYFPQGESLVEIDYLQTVGCD